MEITTSLQDKKVHIINGDGAARKAYLEVLQPFTAAGATIAFHDTPTAFFNAVRPDELPDLLITAPFFEDDFDGVGLVSKLHREGFLGSSLVGSGSADKILEGIGDTRRVVRSILTGSPDEVSARFYKE